MLLWTLLAGWGGMGWSGACFCLSLGAGFSICLSLGAGLSICLSVCLSCSGLGWVKLGGGGEGLAGLGRYVISFSFLFFFLSLLLCGSFFCSPANFCDFVFLVSFFFFPMFIYLPSCFVRCRAVWAGTEITIAALSLSRSPSLSLLPFFSSFLCPSFSFCSFLMDHTFEVCWFMLCL